MRNHFVCWRACHAMHHHASDVVCTGFYARHRHRCTPLQLADRLDGIVRIDSPEQPDPGPAGTGSIGESAPGDASPAQPHADG